jgi:hypothetical protein
VLPQAEVPPEATLLSFKPRFLLKTIVWEGINKNEGDKEIAVNAESYAF